MTPTFIGPSGPTAVVPGVNLSADQGEVAVLDDQGAVVFVGPHADAVTHMQRHGLREHANAEIIDNRGYCIGFEPF